LTTTQCMKEVERDLDSVVKEQDANPCAPLWKAVS
jgi:hypothetical protein